VDDLLSRMTTVEKIGQMALIEKNSIRDPQDIAKYGLGGLLSGAGAKPKPNTAEAWFQMVKTFQGYAKTTRLGIPLLYGVDANHGHGNVPGATIFPHQIGLGASRDAVLVRDVAHATAEEVVATGINWVYSPNVDVAQDTRWGRVYETFGSDSVLAGALGKAYIEGLQSFEKNGVRVAATAKHFVGNGASEWGSSSNKDFHIDQGASNIRDAEMRRTHLEPFRRAIRSNVQSVMVGLNRWNGEKVVFNKYLLTDVLRTELGFEGFVVSDWYGVYENESSLYQALVRAVNAGVDMVMLPFDYKMFSTSMHQALANGDISQARIDEAVRRILKAKFETGVFDSNTMDHAGNIGTTQHRELARKAVRESLVRLKNDGVVPISKKASRLFVAGSAADNIGMQSGAWTVEWQGIDGNWIPGTSILKGIQERAPASVNVEYDLNADFNTSKGKADVGIAIVGERPYAEGWGDAEDPRLSAQDLATIAKLRRVSKKIVVIIVSGRPLNIQKDATDWNAIIAAWLPGSEGEGIADVLFGDYPFLGRLPVEWNL
jgi:beta-glucosidase